MLRWILLMAVWNIRLKCEGHIHTNPESGVFVMQRKSNHHNVTKTDIFIKDGCIRSSEQLVSVLAGRSYSMPFSTPNDLRCAVTVKIALKEITLDRPYVDVIVLRDHTWPSLFKQKICVTIHFVNQFGLSLTGSCTFAENLRHSCLIRKEIPYVWFSSLSNVIDVSYSIGHHCASPQSTQTLPKITLNSHEHRFQVFPLSASEDGQLSFLTRGNFSFVLDSMGSFLIHYRQRPPDNATIISPQVVAGIKIKILLDSRLEIISASPMQPNVWSMDMSTTEPNYQTTLMLTLLDAISLENGWEGYVCALLIKMTGKHGAFAGDLRENVAIQWSSQFFYKDHLSNETKKVTKFPISADSPYVVASVAKENLMNIAILTGTQSALPMRIFAITEGGQLFDATDESLCTSSQPRILKTSPTCTSVFVDGSELRGLANVIVDVQYRSMSSTAAFTVWYPKLPITVWMSDPILNAVQEWHVPTYKHLPKKNRLRRDARQFVCRNRYQQSEVKILAAFQIVNEATGERQYLSGDADLMFDLTQFASNRVQSSDHDIVTVRKRNGILVVSAKRTGTARIAVKALAPAIDYGSAPVMVTDDRVSATQLNVRVITDAQLHLLPKTSKAFQYELITRIQTSFVHQFQHGSLEVSVLYTDGQREMLSDIDPDQYFLNVFSTDQDAVMIRQQKHSANVELIALMNHSKVTLTTELRSPPFCEEIDPLLPPLTLRSHRRPCVTSGQSQIETFFENDGKPTNHFASDILIPTLNATASASNDSSTINIQPILAVSFVILLIVCLFHIVNCHRRGLHNMRNGYEKLVAPLLARLSSSSSLSMSSGDASATHEEDNKDWVWLPKTHLDESSMGSKYSQRSTLDVSDRSVGTVNRTSPEEVLERRNRSVSVSYRGSEISVFIAPHQSTVAVNEDYPLHEYEQGHRSWRSTNGKSSRIHRPHKFALYEGTTSEHENLYRYAAPHNANAGILRRTSDNTSYEPRTDSKKYRRDSGESNWHYDSRTLRPNNDLNKSVYDDTNTYQSSGRQKKRRRRGTLTRDWSPPKLTATYTHTSHGVFPSAIVNSSNPLRETIA